MRARIFQRAKSAMQSGLAGSQEWELTFPPERGAAGSNTRAQLRLRFDSQEEAIAYAERNGVAYRVEEPKPETRKILSYSENFLPNRVVPWSH